MPTIPMSPAGDEPRDVLAFLATLSPEEMAAVNPRILAMALAASEQRERDAVAATTAAGTVAAVASDAIRDAVALLRGAVAADLPIDLAAVLAAAVERATPADPAVLAAVVAPDPVAPAVQHAGGATRRVRRRVERDWSRVQSGSIWLAHLAGRTGRVQVTVDPDGRGASFRVTTGANRGQTFRSPSRAVQSACENPAGRGRRGEATVNGFLALVLVRDGSGADVIDGDTLDDITGT